MTKCSVRGVVGVGAHVCAGWMASADRANVLKCYCTGSWVATIQLEVAGHDQTDHSCAGVTGWEAWCGALVGLSVGGVDGLWPRH